MSVNTVYRTNMTCGVCRKPFVNKVADKTFLCFNCNQTYIMHKTNYKCPMCKEVWREEEDGSKYEGWVQLAFVYEHVNRKCPSCREERIGRQIFE